MQTVHGASNTYCNHNFVACRHSSYCFCPGYGDLKIKITSVDSAMNPRKSAVGSTLLTADSYHVGPFAGWNASEWAVRSQRVFLLVNVTIWSQRPACDPQTGERATAPEAKSIRSIGRLLVPSTFINFSRYRYWHQAPPGLIVKYLRMGLSS